MKILCRYLCPTACPGSSTTAQPWIVSAAFCSLKPTAAIIRGSKSFRLFSGVCTMNLSRRTWMTSSAAAAVAVLTQADSRIASGAIAADPVKRPGAPLLKLSLAGYSFNQMFAKRGTPDEIAKAEMSL